MFLEEEIKKLLTQVQSGATSIEEAIGKLKHLPYQDLGYARIDHHRSLRLGFPEVVYGKGKTAGQIIGIINELRKHNPRVIATKVSPEISYKLAEHFPQAVYHEEAKIFFIGEKPQQPYERKITIITAGTADIPVAEEAALTAEILGNSVERLYDLGIAGIQRLLATLPKLEEALVLIVIAGMDGVLPSVVAGMVPKPVIAVPTSTGYGANFQGLAPLLTMLNSCAPGIGVVNIDNGFGAAILAHLITKCGGYKNEDSLS